MTNKSDKVSFVRVKKRIAEFIPPWAGLGVAAAAAALFLPKVAQAHCPLCVVGAGLAATLAASLGMSMVTIGLFIGAFAAAMGLWFSKLAQRKLHWNFPMQKSLITLASFVLTIIPLIPLMEGTSSYYLMWGGEYGSMFNKTYTMNSFLLGSIIGLAAVAAATPVSRALSKSRNGKNLPFQTMGITFISLIILSLIIELRP